MQLMNHQKEAINKIKNLNNKCLVAYEMGLGKTIIALKAFENLQRVLIICPAAVKYNWREEAQKWINKNIQIIENGRDAVVGNWVICSYSIATKRFREFLELKFDGLIIDESHYIKNIKTKRSKACIELSKNINQKLLLTGTPYQNSALDLYPQLLALGFFGKFMKFANEFCHNRQIKIGRRFVNNFYGVKNEGKLKNILKHYLIRKTKTEVLDLPPFLRQKISIKKLPINFNSDLIIKLKKQGKTTEEIINELNNDELNSMLFSCYSAVAEAKAKLIPTFLEEAIETKKPFVIFAHHKVLIKSIEEYLLKNKIKFKTIDGSVKSETRQEIVNQFQAGDLDVVVCSMTATGVGITLTRAEFALFMELPFVPATAIQSEARLHRIGQKNSVIYKYFISDYWLEKKLWGMLKQKSIDANSVVNGEIFDSNENVDFKNSVNELITELINNIN